MRASLGRIQITRASDSSRKMKSPLTFRFCTLPCTHEDKLCARVRVCVHDPHCIQQYLYLVPFPQNNRIFLGSQIARFLSFRAASPPSCLRLWREEISLISHFTCHPVWGSVSLITSCPWASVQLCPLPRLIAFPLPSACTLYFTLTFAWTCKLEAKGGFRLNVDAGRLCRMSMGWED